MSGFSGIFYLYCIGWFQNDFKRPTQGKNQVQMVFIRPQKTNAREKPGPIGLYKATKDQHKGKTRSKWSL
ncbi:hypothetical protein CWO92_19430 [Heyndrickxia camelliae]|uniref:Uncharacterized protein n=1 Tax=Heyndrickxia camelliae TaxID=1707093 RepID=A0A2N3LFQ3_9BACI|nr:hypothetical protein CWO92_19430 [Heyndrickxia camelliae]